MKKMVSGGISWLIALLLAFTMCESVFAAETGPSSRGGMEGKIYYMAPDGSDRNPGSFTKPFATLETAMNALEPGDLLYVRGGTYVSAGTGGGVSDRNGSQDRWYTVQAYPGETPVFDGDWGRVNGGAGFGIWFKNCSYWHVEGLHFCKYQETGAYLDEQTSHIRFVNDTFSDIYDLVEPDNDHGRSGITSMGADDILVDGCEFYRIGLHRPSSHRMHDHGIYICNSGVNWSVKNSYFHDIPSGGGIQFYGNGSYSDNVVENNLFVRTRMGVILGGPSCTGADVRRNTFYHGGLSDVFLTEGAHGNTIHHNIFGPMAPDATGIVGYHIQIPLLNCLYNALDFNFYDDSMDSSSVYPVKIDNWVNGNTYTQKVTWDVWTAEKEDVIYEEAYDGSKELIAGFGQEARGQTGAVRFHAPEQGDFSLAQDSECSIGSIGMADSSWSHAASAEPPVYIIPNFGFEEGMKGWDAYQWGTGLSVEIVSDRAASGLKSLKIAQNDNANNGMLELADENYAPVTPGHEYEISLKTINGLENGSIGVYVKEYSEDNIELEDAGTIGADSQLSASWKTFKTTYRIRNRDTRYLRIWYLIRGTGVCYLDDMNIHDRATAPEDTAEDPDHPFSKTVVSNAGFESELAGSWDLPLQGWGESMEGMLQERTAAERYSGEYALHLENANAGNKNGLGTNWRTPLEGGKTYRISAKVKTSAATAADAKMFFIVDECNAQSQHVAAERYYQAGAAVTGPQTEWTTMSGTFTTHQETARGAICLFAQGKGDFYFDEVTVVPYSPGQEDEAEVRSMLTNPSFEQGLRGWEWRASWGSDTEGASVEAAGDTAYTGKQSLHIVNRNAGNKTGVGTQHVVQVEPNQSYLLRMRVKTSGDTSPDAKVFYYFQEANGSVNTSDYYTTPDVLTGPQPDWATLGTMITTNGQTHNINVCVFLEGQGEVWIDDVCMAACSPRESLAVNYSFEQGLTGWNNIANWSGSGTVRIDDQQAYDGFNSVRITNPEKTAETLFGNYVPGYLIRCDGAGKTYKISAKVRTDQSIADDAEIKFYLREFNADLNEDITAEFSAEILRGRQSDWTTLSAYLTLDERSGAFAVYGMLKGAGTVWFDEIIIREAGENLNDLQMQSLRSIQSVISDKSLYREAQQAEIETAVRRGTEAVKEASTRDGILTAAAQARDALEAIPTREELDTQSRREQEALAAAIASAKTAVEQMADPDAYRPPVSTEVFKIIRGAQELLDLADSQQRVQEIVGLVETLVGGLKTDAELTAEELAAAKTLAREQLASYAAAGRYSAEKQAQLARIISDGTAAIESGSDLDAVARALAAAQAAVDSIPVYDSTSENGGCWMQGSIGGISFVFSAAPSKLQRVAVDGAALDAAGVSDESGGTRVTLSAQYLQTLGIGAHTLRVDFTDGFAQVQLTIRPAEAPEDESIEPDAVPATGSSGLAAAAALLGLSGTLLFCTAGGMLRRRRGK